MIGPIVNSGGLFIGGIIGVIFADIFPERLKKALPSIFGVITLCLGATLVGKATALPAVTISLILGTMVGEIMYAEALLQKVLRAIFGLLKSKRMGDENFSLMVITLVAAFCFGSMGFLGAFHEGLTGNPDILLTKAALDMFTGVVFGSFMGFSVSSKIGSYNNSKSTKSCRPAEVTFSGGFLWGIFIDLYWVVFGVRLLSYIYTDSDVFTNHGMATVFIRDFTTACA